MFNTQIIARANEDDDIIEETIHVIHGSDSERLPEEMDIVAFEDQDGEIIENLCANYLSIFRSTDDAFNYIYLN
jgi:hypothetical protein